MYQKMHIEHLKRVYKYMPKQTLLKLDYHVVFALKFFTYLPESQI